MYSVKKKKANLKKRKLEVKKNVCACISIHPHTCTCLCVPRGSPGDTQEMVALVLYKKGTWGLGNRGERETF